MMEIASKSSSLPGEIQILGSSTGTDNSLGNESKDGAEKALEDARRMQEELTQQSLQSEEGYREFQERLSKEERMENIFRVRRNILPVSDINAEPFDAQFGFAFSLFLLFWLLGATIFSKTEVSRRETHSRPGVDYGL
jgi:potassium channel subfamily K